MKLRSRHPLTLVYEIPVEKISKFWEMLKEGKVVAPRCRKCGSLYFPPQADCPKCLASEMEWVELSSRGTLETYSHVMVGPKSFANEIPYTVAVGRLEEGIAILARMREVEYAKIRIGMELKLSVREVGEDRFVYEWLPADRLGKG